MNENFKNFSDLVNLTWVALGQENEKAVSADPETLSFFCSKAFSTPVPKKACIQKAPIIQKAPTCLPNATILEEVPIESDIPPQSSTKRLEKLLPRTSQNYLQETISMRREVLAKGLMSTTPLYQDPPSAQIQRWAVFTHLTESSPPTPQQKFVQTVIKATTERLPVSVDLYSVSDPLFSLKLPMACSDCAVVLIFVEAHLEKSLLDSLTTISLFIRAAKLLDPPFVVPGTIGAMNIRTIPLHPSTPDEPAVKAQLWQGLKALATLSSPY